MASMDPEHISRLLLQLENVLRLRALIGNAEADLDGVLEPDPELLDAYRRATAHLEAQADRLRRRTE